MELSSDFYNLVFRFLFNISVAYLIIMQIYKRFHDSNDFVFTYFMFNSLIFFFAYILGNMDINIGFAFGLFAVFAILRYRTEVSQQELIFANFIIIILTYILENHGRIQDSEKLLGRRTIEYDKLENIKPENHKDLLIDLENRTGLSIQRFEIGRIFLDRVNIKIFYEE